MIPVNGYEGQRVGVLGLGRSGLATARSLRAGGAEPVCWDDNEASRDRADGVKLADLTDAREVEGLAALIVSPGIPHLYPKPHPAVTAAQHAEVPLDNEVGLFFRTVADLEPDDDGPPHRIVAITGSNGKSTTTALVRHILDQAGRTVQMGGNIGRAVLDLDPPGAGEVMVLELSSYQTELARMLAPDIAVFLNLSPDHLDRHGGLGGYFAAKRRLFETGAPEHAVIGIDEPEGRYLAGRVEGSTLISVRQRLKGDGRTVFMNRSHLTEWRGGRQLAAIDMRDAETLLGRHNQQNAAAAYAVCRLLGLGPRPIELGLMSFPGLAHRMERLGAAGGVAWVNDSKATNADAAEKALLSYDRIRWILGGQAKAGGIEALRPLFHRIAHAYLIGEAAEVFADTLADVPHTHCATLDAAVSAAQAEAERGDTVLLSPACASFDQFPSFEARGDAFRALVAQFLEPETTT